MPEDFTAIEAALCAAESARRAALVDDDRTALSLLMADDLVHVHTTGIVHDKEQLLDHTGSFLRFHDVRRGALTVRIVGPNVAIMTGSMTNSVSRRGSDEVVEINAFVTQVWVDRGEGWRLLSFHAVRLPEHEAH